MRLPRVERPRQLCARLDPQLAIDATEVRLDRLAADEDVGGDRLVREPAAARRAMRSSVGVRSVGAARVAVRAWSSRARSPHCRAPSSSNSSAARANSSRACRFCLRRRRTWPVTSSVRASSKGMGHASCSARARSSAPAAPSRSPSAASRSPWQRAATARFHGIPDRAAAVERCEHRARAVEVAGSDRSLDRVALDAPDRRLAEADPLPRRDRRSEMRGGRRRSRRRRARRDRECGPRASARSARPSCRPRARRRRVQDGRRRTHARCCWRHVDAGEREPLVRAVGELRGEFPVTGPALEQHPVEEDVGERRLVALVQRGVLRQVELPARAVEVVDIPQPLAELEDDARVHLRRRRAASSSSARSALLGRDRRRGRGRRALERRVRARRAQGRRFAACEELGAARAASAARTRSLVPAQLAIAAWQRARRSGSAASCNASSHGRPRPTRLRASTRCRRGQQRPGAESPPAGSASCSRSEPPAGSRPRSGGGPPGRVAARRTRLDRRVSRSASSVSSAALSGAPRARAHCAAASSTRAASGSASVVASAR